MSLLALPNELLLQIISSLSETADLLSLLLTNRRLSLLLPPILRQHAVLEERAMTALFWAAAIGDRTMIQLVLENGPGILAIDAHTRDKMGDYGPRVIHCVPVKCSNSTVERVVACGADLLLTRPQVNAVGGTFSALRWAAFKGHVPMVRLLLDMGVDINENSILWLTSVGLGSSWSKPLHTAAYEGHVPVVQLLLERGADVSAVDLTGSTAIYLAAKTGREAVVKLLLEKGAKVNEPRGPLWQAAILRHEGVVKLLLENGADPNIQSYGETLLRCLVGSSGPPRIRSEGRDRIIKLLLEHGADPTIPDSGGMSPLYWAQLHGDEGLQRVISEKYPWHGVGFEYWQSRSYGKLIGAGKHTTLELKKERKQSYREWKIRRWCRQKQIAAKVDCIRAFRSLNDVFIRDEGCGMKL